jgi:rubrerythrin
MAILLTEKQKKLLLFFKDAIQREQGAQELYACIADHCEDPALRDVMVTIGQEEKRHEEALLSQYKALRATAEYGDELDAG